MRRSAAALGRRVQQTAPQHRCRPTLKVSSQHMNWNELNLSATSRPSYTQFTSPGQTRQNSPVCVVSASAVWIGFSTTQDCSRQKKWSLNTLITSALHSATPDTTQTGLFCRVWRAVWIEHYTTRSLVTCVSVTTWLAAANVLFGRPVLSQFVRCEHFH